MCGRVRILQAATKKVMHVSVNVKAQWRLQDIRDARNMECPSRKTIGNKLSQSKTEAMVTKGHIDGVSQHAGDHIMTPSTLLDMELQDLMFSLLGFVLILV
jgi:hypothetical protein